MTIDGKQLLPVLESVADLMDAAATQHRSDSGTITELQRKLAQANADKIVLEKVASAPRPTLDPVFVKRALSQLVTMRLLSPGEDAKLASELNANPNAALNVIVKMAESLVTPSEGREYVPDVDDKLLDDQDGWFKHPV